MTNNAKASKRTQFKEVKKEDVVDIYANGVTVTINNIECLLTFHKETPSQKNDGVVYREDVAKIRLHPAMAQMLVNTINQIFEKQIVDKESTVE